MSESGKQCTVKCFYTSCFTCVTDGVGSDFGGRRRACFGASLYCSRGISFNIKGQKSHFAISQQLLSPEPRRKTFTLQASLSRSHSQALSFAFSLSLFPSLSNSAFVSFRSFLQSKQTAFWVIPHNPSLCLCRAPEPATLGPFNRPVPPCDVQGPRSSTQSSLLFICQSPELQK